MSSWARNDGCKSRRRTRAAGRRCACSPRSKEDLPALDPHRFDLRAWDELRGERRVRVAHQDRVLLAVGHDMRRVLAARRAGWEAGPNAAAGSTDRADLAGFRVHFADHTVR